MSLIESILNHTRIGVAALQIGVSEEALRRTAEYTATRKQFGRAIGTFQAVTMRSADGYIDIESMRSTLWQAAWRLENDLSASQEAAAAAWWACEGAHRVVHTAQHLHGGMIVMKPRVTESHRPGYLVLAASLLDMKQFSPHLFL